MCPRLAHGPASLDSFFAELAACWVIWQLVTELTEPANVVTVGGVVFENRFAMVDQVLGTFWPPPANGTATIFCAIRPNFPICVI